MYIRTAFSASLAAPAPRVFNNFCVFNTSVQFDSPRLHHIRQGYGVPSEVPAVFAGTKSRGTSLYVLLLRPTLLRQLLLRRRHR